MIKRLVYILCCLLTLWICGSCMPDPELTEIPASHDEGYVKLVFATSHTATRATAPDNEVEAALKHLDVLMYRKVDESTYTPFYHERVNVTQTPDGSVYLKRKRDDFEREAEYKIYVIANSTLPEETFRPQGELAIAHEQLLRLEQTDAYIHLSGIEFGTDNTIYPQQFLMDGVVYMGSAEPQTPGTIVVNDPTLTDDDIILRVKLRRAAAKFVIKFYPGEKVSFTPELLAQSEGYMMRNMPQRTRVIAEGNYPSTLTENYWKSTTISQSPYFEYITDGDSYYLQVTAYTYSHHWQSAEFFDKGTSLVLMLPIIYTEGDTQTIYKNNYYQLVLNKKEEGEDYDHLIRRNTLYELRVTLDAPGAEDFTEPQELKNIYYFTTPWTEKGLDVSGEMEVAYLKVNKQKLYMYNVAEDINSLYFSSSSPITTEIVSGSAYYKNKYGENITIAPDDYNMNITANATSISGNINVHSDIPTNNTIRFFKIRVTNQEGLEEIIDVEQYPLIYITNSLPWYSYRDDFYYRSGHSYNDLCNSNRDGLNVPTTLSTGGDRIASIAVESVNTTDKTVKYKYSSQGGSGYGFFSSKQRGTGSNNLYANNFYFYCKRFLYITWTTSSTVNTSTCESNANLRNYHVRMMATSDEYKLGRPRMDENGFTASDAENAQLVSPSFVIASRLGAIYSSDGGLGNLSMDKKLIVFHDHAKNYVEVDDIDDAEDHNRVVVYDNWRLPTKAELEIIIKLQGSEGQDADAIDFLLNGGYYMSASGPVYNPKNSSNVTELDDPMDAKDVAIRCVRDVYY